MHAHIPTHLDDLRSLGKVALGQTHGQQGIGGRQHASDDGLLGRMQWPNTGCPHAAHGSPDAGFLGSHVLWIKIIQMLILYTPKINIRKGDLGWGRWVNAHSLPIHFLQIYQ